MARGARDIDLTRAVRGGGAIRARQGWYTTLPASDLRVRAVRVGGRLTGLSAIHALGGWVVEHRTLHVSVTDNAARLRSASNRYARFRPGRGTVVHWDSRDLDDRGSVSSVALADALLRVVIDEPFEEAVAALDWALHSGMLDEFDFEALILSLPKCLRGIRHWVDPQCESITESLARTRFRQRGHVVESQIKLETGERIDLLVDGEVGFEANSKRWHLGTFEKDHAKQITITLAGFHGISATANAILGDWERLQRAVDVALEHRGVTRVSKTQDIHPGRSRRIPEPPASRGHPRPQVLSFRDRRE